MCYRVSGLHGGEAVCVGVVCMRGIAVLVVCVGWIAV